jgi:hypothetical protein
MLKDRGCFCFFFFFASMTKAAVNILEQVFCKHDSIWGAKF